MIKSTHISRSLSRIVRYGMLFGMYLILSCVLILTVAVESVYATGGFKTIESAPFFNVGIGKDGSLWTWGTISTQTNLYGELGNGTTNPPTEFVPARVGDDNDWDKITVAIYHSLAIKKDGSLWGWGLNGSGQLGDGTLANRHSPVQIGRDKNWSEIITIHHATFALKNDGSLWVWGGGLFSTIFQGDLYAYRTPTQVGGDTDWKTIIPLSEYGLLILKQDGSLWALGEDRYQSGSFGNGSTDACYSSPVLVGNGDTDWNEVWSDGYSTFAIKRNGSLWGWGRNGSGQLGDGTTIDRLNPVPIGNDRDWETINRGSGSCTFGIKSNGELWAWGSAVSSTLGDGVTEQSLIPIRIGNSTDWQKAHIRWTPRGCVVIKADGSLWGWGSTWRYLGLFEPYRGFDSLEPIRIGNSFDWVKSVQHTNSNGGQYLLKNDGTLWQWDLQELISVVREGPTFFWWIPNTGGRVSTSSKALPALVFVSGTYNQQVGRRFNPDTAVDERILSEDVVTDDRYFDELWDYAKSDLTKRQVGYLYKVPSYPNEAEGKTLKPYTLNSEDGKFYNSNAISAFLEETVIREGIKEVIFVTYSKGGLDVREYLDSENYANQKDKLRVKGVIQLAAPNAGTPIAPTATSGWITTGLGFAASKICPATADMEPSIAKDWNRFSRNPHKVPLYTIAGDYFYGESTLDALIDYNAGDLQYYPYRGSDNYEAARTVHDLLRHIFKDEPNDGTVPLWSARNIAGNDMYRAGGRVEKLPVKHASAFPLSLGSYQRGETVLAKFGNDPIRTASITTNSTQIKRHIKTFLDEMGAKGITSGGGFRSTTSSISTKSLQDDSDIKPLSFEQNPFVLSLSQQVASHPVRFSGNQALISLESPVGVSLSIKDAGGESLRVSQIDEGIWHVRDIVPDEYTLEVLSSDVKDTTINILDFGELGLMADAPASGNKNGSVEVAVSLQDIDRQLGGTITSASCAVGEAGVPSQLSGDKTATGTVVLPNVSGLTFLLFEVSGIDDSGNEFERIAVQPIRVTEPVAEFSDAYSLNMSLDQDGKIESLELSVGIIGKTAAKVSVIADITDAGGNLLAQPCLDVDLDSGFDEMVKLHVDSDLIHQNMVVEGAINVSEVRLVHRHDDYSLIINSASDVATSVPLYKNDFVSFGGTFHSLDSLHEGEVTLRGTVYATSGTVTGVQVSFDAGETWYDGEIQQGAGIEDLEWSIDVSLEEGPHGVFMRPVVEGMADLPLQFWTSAIFEVLPSENPSENHWDITFDSQGGSAVASQTIEHDGFVTEPTDPTWTGYDFLGWFTEPVGGTQFDFGTPIIEDLVLYAHWQETMPGYLDEFTVTFDSQGGSAVADANVSDGSIVTEPVPPVRDGYLFDGWYTDTTYATAWNFELDVITVDRTFYAKWLVADSTITGAVTGNDGNPMGVYVGVWTFAPTPVQIDVYRFDTSTGDWNWCARTKTDYYGKYALSVAGGQYRVKFDDTRMREAIEWDEWDWGTAVWGGGDVTPEPIWWNQVSSADDAGTLDVADGETLAGIDAQFNRPSTRLPGTISGRVTNASGEPLEGIIVRGGDWALAPGASYEAYTNEDGYYTLIFAPLTDDYIWTTPILAPDSRDVLVGTYDPLEFYASISISAVTIVGGHNTPNIDFELNKAGSFSGTTELLYDITAPDAYMSVWGMLYMHDAVIDQWVSVGLSFDATSNDGVIFSYGKHDLSAGTYRLSLGYFGQIDGEHLSGYGFYGTNGTFVNDVESAADITVTEGGQIVLSSVTIDTQSHEVTFDSQGGSMIPSQRIRSGSRLFEPSSPFRAGYMFAGWYKETTYLNAWNFSSDAVTSDLTLYAKWDSSMPVTDEFTVTFDSQGGSSVAAAIVEDGSVVAKPTDPTRTGYTFADWYTDTSHTTAWNFMLNVITDNITLYAKWDINSYSVTFDSQGGSTVSSQNIDYGTLVTDPMAPTRNGYIFAGWYKEATCTNAWSFTGDTVTDATTLYAKWDAPTKTTPVPGGGALTVKVIQPESGIGMFPTEFDIEVVPIADTDAGNFPHVAGIDRQLVHGWSIVLRDMTGGGAGTVISTEDYALLYPDVRFEVTVSHGITLSDWDVASFEVFHHGVDGLTGPFAHTLDQGAGIIAISDIVHFSDYLLVGTANSNSGGGTGGTGDGSDGAGGMDNVGVDGSENPATGDSTTLMPWLMLVIVGVVVTFMGFIIRGRKKAVVRR